MPRRGAKLRTTPRTRPSTWAMVRAASRACSLWVRPTAKTSRAPSHRGASTTASVTGSSGGASRMTTWSRLRCSTSWRIRVEPSSSLGFGGVRPAGMRRTLAWSVSRRTSRSETWPVSSWESPTRPSVSKIVERVGRRRSASMTTTDCPASPRTRARVAATVDLPSWAFALVTTMLRGGSSTPTKRRLVRICRNDSEAEPSWSSRPRPSSPLSSRTAGTTPSTLAPVSSSTSGTVRSRVSSWRRARTRR